jgi:hypothetical protein
MKLPHLELAQVRRKKIVDSLLSPTHRDGRSKHDFFVRFGFRPEEWEQLRDALMQHASDNDVTSQEQTILGVRYLIDGALRCPDGRHPLVRVVWFADFEDNVPRLVTAYPLER